MSARGTACLVAAVGALGCTSMPQSSAPIPADVARFVERREICDHFRGEEPYSPERRAYLEAASEEFCRGTDRELAGLRSKYQGDAAILRILDPFEQDIEAQ